MKHAPLNTPLDTARAAWGADLPDWIEALAKACTLRNQVTVARDLDRSGAVISQVLRRVYPADMARIEDRVRGVLMDGKVSCPGMGEMPVHQCQDWRDKAREFVIGNPLRTRMYRACLTCPRNQKEAPE